MSKQIRYTLIASILITMSIMLLPGSSAQRNDNPQATDEAATQGTGRTVQEASPDLALPDNLTAVGTQDNPNAGIVTVLVELTDAPASVVYAEVMERSSRGKDKGVVAEAVKAGQTQFAKIKQQQTTLSAVLQGPKFNAQEIYRVQLALNGIAVRVDASKIDELRRLPGVKVVSRLELEYPSNSTSVPFIGAPQVWGGPLGVNVKGDGMRIGIIDTGVDYQHSNFGGTGALTDYQANNRTVAPDTYFPTAKVVGGRDFAGDNYNGNNAPAPDPDPMDCNGHGSHVAGTAAGFGVKADGTTYTGPFTGSVDYSPLRIGPGSAPGAQLYALRVFGCIGGTNLTVQAIDWTLDPNGDTDLSDHLDVINMSLGGVFGSIADVSARASDNAARVGVVVVAAAGNSGDTFFIDGAPGSGSRVISTAASGDTGINGNAVRVNAPPAIAGYYNAVPNSFGNPPPASGVTADVVVALDPADGAGPSTTDACSPLTNAGAVAGKIAIVDRGTCNVIIKVKNAQNAGAVGVMVANNVAGAAAGFSGTDPTVVIPSVGISQADGNLFKANIPPLNVTLFNGADTMAGFSSRGPRLGLKIDSPTTFSFGSTTAFQLKPDVTAPGLAITSTQTGVTCVAPQPLCTGVPTASGFLPDNQALTIQGTSMATPHVAGLMALLKQLHPDWTVEELKALVMNGATHDITQLPGGGGARFSPSRQGAGRVDAPNSATLPVVAFNADEPGVVSLSFDTQVLGTLTQTKRVRVVNNSATAQTYDLGIDTTVDAPGAGFSIPPGPTSITVPAGGSVVFNVQFAATASFMDHRRDPTQATTQASSFGAASRHWLTEEGGYVTFKQGGVLKLRVPLYTAPRPASDMSAPPTIATGGVPTGSTVIPLSGTGLCTGGLLPGPTCGASFPNDEESLVTPFELQVVSPRDPGNNGLDGFRDLQYAGVAKQGNTILFGVSTWDKWSTPTDTTFNIYIDNNLDGTYDRILFNVNLGRLSRIFVTGNTDDTDVQYSIVAHPIPAVPPSTPPSAGLDAIGIPVNGVDANVVDTALYNNRVMFIGASAASLGLTSANAPFRYKIYTCPGTQPLCQQLSGAHSDEAPGPYTWSGGAQGLNFGGGILFEDLNGASIPVSWNSAAFTANGSLGALLLHHHNVDGRQAELVAFEGLTGAQTADLALSYSASPPNPNLGQNTTLTLTVTNNGPNDATGVQVYDPLPPSLTYVSDDGAGTYDPNTGIWNAGAVTNGSSKTLHIVVTVQRSAEAAAARLPVSTDPVVSTAQISGGTPIDTVPANNQAVVVLTPLRSADLALTASASASSANVGDSVTFTFTVTNNGEDPAFNVRLTETLPGFPALLPSSFTVNKGIYTPATGLWTIASLGKGATATLTITVTIPQSCPTFSAQATVIADENDPNLVNNTATAVVNINQAQVVLSAATYSVGEADGHVTVTVSRAVGCASNALTVQYVTSDPSGLTNCDVVTGNASSRCDYTTAGGTLNFAAGETSRSFDIPIINDAYVEGSETFTLTLSNPTGGVLGTPASATITITDNDVAPGPNPIDTADFFIRQQYLDILGREPDPPGFAGWQSFLSTCAAGSTACDRTELAIRFFRSQEFFDRAYYIYRFYRTALGRKPTFDEYQTDLRKVAGFLTNAELDARKAAYAEEFSQRADFKAFYDSKADGDDYVNAIVGRAGIVPSNRTSVSIRQGALLITRGRALRELLESPEISAGFFNEAFVVVGYFAYLRREPDAQYLVFLAQLNSTGNYREAIRNFIESQEYRRRFGL